MHIEHLEKQASVELVAQPFSDKDVSLSAELLRSRIEELDRRLASLNSDRTLLQRLRR
jgi:hypothetical protein